MKSVESFVTLRTMAGRLGTRREKTTFDRALMALRPALSLSFFFAAAVVITSTIPAAATGTWAPLGPGLGGADVKYLHVWDGKLIAAGSFSTAGGVPVRNIAAWDGAQWTPFAEGWDSVGGITTHNGQLIVSGLRADSTDSEIALWDGTGWATVVKSDRSNLSGINNLNNLASLSGNLYQVTYNGYGPPNWSTSSLWEYDGAVWREINRWGSQTGTCNVNALTVLDGELYLHVGPLGIVNSYDGAAGTTYGATEIEIGMGMARVNDVLYVGGYVPWGYPAVVRWNGASWDVILYGGGCSSSNVEALANFDGKLAIAGILRDTCFPASSAALWDGLSWFGLHGRMNDEISALTAYNGSLIAAGSFDETDSVSTPLIAEYIGTTTPVAISGLTVNRYGDGVELSWQIAADEAFDGFYLYRSENGGTDELVNLSRLSPNERRYIDRSVTPGGRYSYVLVAVGAASGEFRSHRVEIVLPALSALLYQNVPNPFNPETTIRFVVPTRDLVTIDVYGASGRRVRTLVNTTYAAGEWSTSWNGTDDAGRQVASGVYYYRMRIGSLEQAKKMVLLK